METERGSGLVKSLRGFLRRSRLARRLWRRLRHPSQAFHVELDAAFRDPVDELLHLKGWAVSFRGQRMAGRILIDARSIPLRIDRPRPDVAEVLALGEDESRVGFEHTLDWTTACGGRPEPELALEFTDGAGRLVLAPVSITSHPDPKRHRRRFQRYFQGDGIEIGALHSPMPVDRGRATVRYVDRLPLSEQQRHYPELSGHSFMEPDLIAEADRLAPLPDASQDFIIANHLLEHLPDPMGALKEWYRVMKPGGVLFLALPDKRLMFDRDRPRTTLAHLIADHRDRGEASKAGHYREYVRLVDRLEGAEAEREVERLTALEYGIHFHVWVPEDIQELIGYVGQELGLRWRIRERVDGAGADEFIYVLEKPA